MAVSKEIVAVIMWFSKSTGAYQSNLEGRCRQRETARVTPVDSKTGETAKGAYGRQKGIHRETQEQNTRSNAEYERASRGNKRSQKVKWTN
jgi:ribosomal protein L20